jgi:hypothetical protein
VGYFLSSLRDNLIRVNPPAATGASTAGEIRFKTFASLRLCVEKIRVFGVVRGSPHRAMRRCAGGDCPEIIQFRVFSWPAGAF